MPKYWVIDGYDSNTRILSDKFPYEEMSEDVVRLALRCLVAKNLTNSEIISTLKNSEKLSGSSLLDPIGDKSGFHYGVNPYFIARIVNE